MKKLMMLILGLMLCVPVLAENPAPIPVEIVEAAPEHIKLDTAITKALAEISVKPEKHQIRAELVKMSDGTFRWVVTVFDLTSLSDGWCVELDALTGAVVDSYTTNDGFFTEPLEKWAPWKGGNTNKAMWRVEEKALIDALYALQPMYGMPQEGDMSASEATERAAAALAPYYPDDKATGYLACPGYIMGGEGYNGIWEICMVDNGQVVYQVNLDAVTGEIYYLSADDNGNG